VPLSPVAPLPKQSTASWLRYVAVIGVAAILVFVLVRALHHTGSTDQASAALAEKRLTPPAPLPRLESKANAQPPRPNAESPAAPPSAAAVTAPQPPPAASNAVDVKTAVSGPEPALAAAKSEVKAPAPTASDDAEVVREVLPEISEKALSTIQGKVRLTVRVQTDSSGKVNDAQLSRPCSSSFFNDAALRAARKWEFQPGDTTATEMRSYLLQFEFTPAGAKASASRTE